MPAGKNFTLAIAVRSSIMRVMKIRMAITALCLAILFPVSAVQSQPSSARQKILGRLTLRPQTISVFGQHIVYFEAGQGRPVILLSNLGWDSHAWWQNLLELARHYRVIAGARFA